MQSRTASRDGKCFLSDNFISLSLQLRRSALPTEGATNSSLILPRRFVTCARVNVTRHFSAIAPIHPGLNGSRISVILRNSRRIGAVIFSYSRAIIRARVLRLISLRVQRVKADEKKEVRCNK